MDTLRLKNYRCFTDTGDIDFRPINFLVGSNSSGKSSFIKMFPLIKQSVGIKRNGVFLWYGNEVDFKDFANVIKEGQSFLEIEFLVKKFRIPQRGFLKSIDETNLKVNMRLSQKDKDFDYLESLTISFEDQKIKIYYNPKRSSVKIEVNGIPTEEDYDRVIATETNSLLPRLLFISKNDIADDYPMWCETKLRELQFTSSFSQYRKISRSLKLGSKEDVVNYITKQLSVEDKNTHINKLWLNNIYLLLHINNIIDGINLNLLSLSNNISYVGPLRATTQRYYRFQNYAVEEIDSDGKNLAMYLYNLDKESLNNFKNWTRRLFGFEVEVSSVNGNMELIINEEGKEKHNMVDVGFGYTQILPILAIIWKTLYKDFAITNYSRTTGRNQYIVAIEQPELHLHPRLQGLFASMLVTVIKEAKEQGRDIRFIIETHSEIIISRIGQMIATHEFSNEDINVFIFNAANEGMQNYIEKSYYSEDGQLINWPYGFFSDYVFED